MIKRIIVLTLLIIATFLVSGCSFLEFGDENLTDKKEEIVSIAFTDKNNWTGQKDYIVTIQSRTIVWSDSRIEVKRTDESTDFVKYKEDDEGAIYGGTIYLSDEGVKKYSKLYAETYGYTLPITR